MERSPFQPTFPPSLRRSSRSWAEPALAYLPKGHNMTSQNLANPELAACEVHGMTRSSFILRGALAAGAVYGTSAVTPFVSSALAQTADRKSTRLNSSH